MVSLTRRTAGCGPACPVVWEGRTGNRLPYPDYARRLTALPYFSLARWTGGLGPVRKNLTSEAANICVRIAPGIRRQLRLAACFGKELLGAEMVLDGHLGKQQPALAAPRNQQAM